MSKRLELFKKVAGQEAYEALKKAIVKLPTSTVVDITEAHDALQIAPKSVMTFLIKELKDLKEKENKQIKLPFSDDECTMLVNKLTNDVYSGHIVKNGKIAHEFANCSIPQLSSHLLSFFELYDEYQQDQGVDNQDSEIKEKLKSLEEKIDKLFMMAAENKQPQIVVNTSEAAKIEKNDKKAIYKKLKNKLQKAGLQPKMPSPPKPGVKVGGSNGITRAGIKGDKTASTDTTVKVRLKRPQPKNTMNVTKSEIMANCSDCGHQNSHCLCFRALSQPKIVKNEKGIITLKFESDWDLESLEAFYKSIKKKII